MAVGGSTCGAKLGGAKKNNKKYGGNANPGGDYVKYESMGGYSDSSGNVKSVMGGVKKNNKKYGGNANPGGDYVKYESMGYSDMSGGKRQVKRVAKPVAKPVAKRVVKRVVKRGGYVDYDDAQLEMPPSYDMSESNENPSENMGEGEMSQPMNGGRKKYTKRGGNADGMPQSLGGAKKRVLTPYNKFVKKHFPAMKVKYPDYKAPQIMKKIAEEWKKTK